MGTITIKPKDRQEWLKYRESGIGSSEVGTILGLNPFETPLQLWRRKKGLDAPKEENFAMKAGHYLEDAVSKFYSDATGKQIIQSSGGDWLMVDEEKPYLRVSPDRTFWIPGRTKSNKNKGILECKTTQMQIDEIPSHWFCQLQYQLGVAGYEQGALAWLTQGRDFGYQDVWFDEELFEFIIGEVDKFWIDNIQGNVEPQPMNVDDIILRNPLHKIGKVLEATEDLYNAYEELKEIKKELSELNAKKESLENIIKVKMEDAEALVEGTTILATWKAPKESEKFDEKRFASENADLYNAYKIKTQGSRRFLIK